MMSLFLTDISEAETLCLKYNICLVGSLPPDISQDVASFLISVRLRLPLALIFVEIQSLLDFSLVKATFLPDIYYLFG